MYWPGHVGIALLLYAPAAYLLHRTRRHRRMWAGGAGVCALVMAPDVDLYVRELAHRGVTHTVWAAFALGAALAVGGWVVCRGNRADAAGFSFQLGALSVLAHLLGDVVTPMGIRPLQPFNEGWYTFDLLAASDPTGNTAMLGVGLSVFGLAVANAREHGPLPGTVPDASPDGAAVREERSVPPVAADGGRARAEAESPVRADAPDASLVGGDRRAQPVGVAAADD